MSLGPISARGFASKAVAPSGSSESGSQGSPKGRFSRFGLSFAAIGGLALSYGAYCELNNPSSNQLPFGDPSLPTLVVLGAGWGSTSFLASLDTENYNVVVVSPRNYFLFTPLLPSCTVGTLELRSLMLPMRFITSRKRRAVKFVEADVTDVDPVSRTVTFQDNSELVGTVSKALVKYDFLVMGVGAENATFGIKGVKEHGLFLKEIWDAKRIRQKLMDCLETASFPGQPTEEVDRLLHMVVVGGGPTGVEYAAELRDFIVEDLRKWFPDVVNRVKITLVEALPHVLAAFDKSLVDYTERHFRQENIEVRLNTMVREVREKEIVVAEKVRRFVTETGEDGKEKVVEKDVLETGTVPYGMLVWAAGNATRAVTQSLISKLPKEKQNQRRGLVVDEHLAVEGAERIYAMGDCTATKYAPTAQVASQQGKYLASLFSDRGRKIRQLASAEGKNIQHACDEVEAKEGEKTFGYSHLGSLAYIGTDQAIADLPGGVRVAGAATYLFWRSVYLSNLFTLRNKMLVSFDWVKKTLFGRDIARE
ncbi:FAD/NAD(P)-binding domain-containing protein [Gonapodya prolifera JEL478]|uniref:NADH:ubiquinone reductase (non-electrogenic) n=1 Tax=Gonapodya prolifera (strain JEL478) TaxID=1344416 RepID=A0A139AJJ1_GONPJ|nr:FAD/NAD(P)-binding domain-containing protein [Gonapodya prolifera JEL478]|eukprot:KXS16878.1 FAD/NAD(P)-binding domain-containing protein [Gonapodya prolifera JEL478]